VLTRRVREPSVDLCTRLSRALARQEAELRELSDRVKLQEELLGAAVDALAAIRDASRHETCKAADRFCDLMFDRRILSDRASFL